LSNDFLSVINKGLVCDDNLNIINMVTGGHFVPEMKLCENVK